MSKRKIDSSVELKKNTDKPNEYEKEKRPSNWRSRFAKNRPRIGGQFAKKRPEDIENTTTTSNSSNRDVKIYSREERAERIEKWKKKKANMLRKATTPAATKSPTPRQIAARGRPRKNGQFAPASTSVDSIINKDELFMGEVAPDSIIAITTVTFTTEEEAPDTVAPKQAEEDDTSTPDVVPSPIRSASTGKASSTAQAMFAPRKLEIGGAIIEDNIPPLFL